MKELKTLADDANYRPQLIADCTELIESEVRSKKGVSGAAVKAAFAVVMAFKPRIIPESVDGLLDDFVVQLQPFFAAWEEQGCPGTLETYLPTRAPEVAEALLSITDARADRSSAKTLVKAYRKLRPKGKVHVEQATPGIGRVLDKHVPQL